MFSLIITIIAIALVAALALATLYYGSSAFNRSSTQAEAVRLMTQSQQLLGAADLFKADHGRWPQNMGELVSTNYLKSIPTAAAQPDQSGILATALATNSAWTMPVEYNPTFVLGRKVDLATCRETNLKALGRDGVLKQAYDTFATQCYGASENALTVITSKDLPHLVDALPTGELASSEPPTAGTGPEWLIEPGSPSTGGTPGGGSGSGDPVTPPPVASSSFSCSPQRPVVDTTGGVEGNPTSWVWVTGPGAATEFATATAKFDGQTVPISLDSAQGSVATYGVTLGAHAAAPSVPLVITSGTGKTATCDFSVSAGPLVGDPIVEVTPDVTGGPGEGGNDVVVTINTGSVTNTQLPMVFVGNNYRLPPTDITFIDSKHVKLRMPAAFKIGLDPYGDQWVCLQNTYSDGGCFPYRYHTPLIEGMNADDSAGFCYNESYPSSSPSNFTMVRIALNSNVWSQTLLNANRRATFTSSLSAPGPWGYLMGSRPKEYVNSQYASGELGGATAMSFRFKYASSRDNVEVLAYNSQGQSFFGATPQSVQQLTVHDPNGEFPDATVSFSCDWSNPPSPASNNGWGGQDTYGKLKIVSGANSLVNGSP